MAELNRDFGLESPTLQPGFPFWDSHATIKALPTASDLFAIAHFASLWCELKAAERSVKAPAR
jgi:hypothetical protein